MSADVHSSPEVTSHAVTKAVDDEELELGLCLVGNKAVEDAGGEFCRILTAEDFPSMPRPPLPASSPSSSSDSSSTYLGFRTKRAAADSDSPEAEGPGKNRRLVGWPPVRAHRMINLFKQSRASPIPDAHSAMKKTFVTTGNGRDKKIGLVNEGQKSTPLFIKVNKDGDPIGRKVDVNAHASYISLSLALEDMFQEQPSLNLSHQIPKGPKLLDGKSELVLTYEDRDGDWMLVGDVPWRMFLGTVRRLRIMRRSDANGFAG